MNKKIYFHVGLAKTGSTFLQKNFFPYLKNIKYISTHDYINCIDIINKTNYKSYLISREFDKQFEREIKKFISYFPDTKIIVVFRRHDQWIASQYKRSVKNGWHWSFKNYYNINNKGIWKNSDLTYMNKLKIIKKYSKSKPLILKFEELKKDPFNYLNKISNYTDSKYLKTEISLKTVHKSYSEKQLIFLKKFCKIFKKTPPIYYDYQEITLDKTISNTNRIKHWLFYRPWWLLFHLVMYTSLLIPKSLIVKNSLINKNDLAEIKNKFKEDWKKVFKY